MASEGRKRVRTVHYNVNDVPVIAPLQEGRGVAIARIRDHRRKGAPPGPRLLPQGAGQFRLGLTGDLRWDPDLGAARLISGPGLGEREVCRDGPMDGGTAGRLLRHVVRADDHLAIGDLAQGARVLAGDAPGTPPLFGQAGIVQPQQAVRPTLRHQGGHALLVERWGLPGCIGQEIWSACGRGASHRRSDGVAVLPLQVCEQTGEVTLHARPAGGAAKQWREGGQLGGELRQDIRTGLRDNRHFHRGYDDFHVSQREYG